jgi:bacterioferritin
MATSDAQTQLLEGLKKDLEGEFQAIIMYRVYASSVQGPYRQELRTFFANEIPEELTHAQLLADKIAALGGEPTAKAAPVKVVADPKQMLEAALEAEVETIGRYIERRKQAEEAQEFGLAADFDQIIADETKHRDELRLMLARWPAG